MVLTATLYPDGRLRAVDEELHVAVAARLRRVGQRYTLGRRALIDSIVGAERPITAEAMSAEAALPQSTTYRNLAILEQAGVIHRVRGADDFARYELAEELGHHHHHLVCVSCGTVEDFTPPPRLERTLADLVGEITTASGFRADAHRLDLLGTCTACGS